MTAAGPRADLAAGAPAPAAAARLLLVEFFPTVLRRNERSMLFPFLQGLARQVRLETRWICFAGEPGRGAPLAGPAVEADAHVFADHLAAIDPTHIVSSAPLPAAMGDLVVARRPTARVLVPPTIGEVRDPRYAEVFSSDPDDRRYFPRCAWFLDWLGRSDAEWDARFLVDDVVPDYRAVMATAAARTSLAHVTLAGGVLCANRRRIRENPVFRDVALPPRASGDPHDGYRGCAFCGSDRVSLTAPGADPLVSIERQLRALLATAGTDGRDKGIYELYDIHAFLRFDELFAIVQRLQMPPGVFLFNPRVDDVLRARGRIEATLPALAAAGHEVRILSMGVESFSALENARFNKGITAAQVDELLAVTSAWRRDYPRVFNPFKAGQEGVELGFIMFTPWTTLADLRANLDGAVARGFAPHGYWLYSTLLLRESMPLFHLAKHDGDLLADAFPDRGLLYGVRRNEGDPSALVPWRFRHPRVADLFALLVRVCAASLEGSDCPFFAGDRDFAVTSRLYREANIGRETTPLAIAVALLEVLEQPRPPGDREALLQAALRRARSGPTRDATPGGVRGGGRARPGAALEIRAVHRVVDHLRTARPAALADVTFEWLEEVAAADRPTVRLGLAVAGRRLVVDLLAGASGPSFVRSRHYRAQYNAATPVASARERDCLVLLLQLLDAQVERERRGGGATGQGAP